MEIRSLLTHNHTLLQHATRMQENERRKIAQDLHDELGQYLNAIRLESASLKSISKNDEKTQAVANRISEHASHAYQMAKQLMYRLRPVALERLRTLRCPKPFNFHMANLQSSVVKQQSCL